VSLDEVLWIEAGEKIVAAHLAEGAFPTAFTLDELEQRLDPARFIRIHRAYIANASKVQELVPWFAGTYVLKLADGTQLPVARRRVRQVRELLGGGG
jgi:DNA-binding LytR/AlgR family response regulator